MCQPKSNGGQRCAGHALKTLQQRTASYEKTPTPRKFEAVLESQALFASTPSGAQALRVAMEQATRDDNTVEATNIARVIEKGAIIRDRNQAIAAITKGNREASALRPVTVQSLDAAAPGTTVNITVPTSEGVNHNIFTRGDDGRWHQGTVDVRGSSAAELLPAYEKAKKKHGASIRFGGAPGPFAHGQTLPGGRGPVRKETPADIAEKDAATLHAAAGTTNPAAVTKLVRDLWV